MKYSFNMTYDHNTNRFKAYISAYDIPNGKCFMVRGGKLVEHGECQQIEEEDWVLNIDPTEAQDFIDSVVESCERMGRFKKPQTDEIRAITNHLEDMRKLVFKKEIKNG